MRWLWFFVAMFPLFLRAQAVDPVPGGNTAGGTPPYLYGIVGGGAVELGQDVVLTVQFYGTGAGQTYQWKKNGALLAGATNSSYTMTNATADVAGTYTVTVSNSAGPSVATTDVTVKALAGPVITAQPRSLVVYANQAATFSVAATGSYPRTYQWRRDGVNVAGATQASFTVPAVTTADAAAYSVVVSNSQGSETSLSASLTVNAAIPPVISTGSPYDATVTAGASLSLSAYLNSGSSPFTYQWLKNGVAVAGGTNSQFTIAATVVADTGKYSVTVTNIAGSATSREAIVTVNPPTPITINTQPQSQALYEGQSLNLNVYLSGSYPVTYQWKKDGTAIAGASSGSFSISAVALTDAGSYTLVATNAAGSVTSNAAVVTVNPAVAPSITTQPLSQNLAYNGYLNLSVVASGSTPFQYQWKKDGTAIAGATYGNYANSSVKPADKGDYTVTITNRAGSVTSNVAKVTVADPVAPTITSDLTDQTVTEGDSVYFSLSVSGTSPMTYQWYANGVALPNGTYSSYSFSSKLASAGAYSVVITNVAGKATSRSATLTVNPLPPPPVATVSNQTARTGQSLYLSAGYSYSSGTTFQWYRNGVAIAGATQSTYSVSSVSAANVGDYFVVLTNSGGSTTSRTGHVDLIQDTTLPAGAWIAAERGGDVIYFVFANPARIERYNVVSDTWLPTITLGRAPGAFAVSSTNLFIASGSIVYRYALDGTGETILNSAFDSNVTGLKADGTFLLASTGAYSSATISTLRPSDGVKISTVGGSYYWSASMAVAPTVSRVFSRTNGISPSDITYLTVQSDGTITGAPKDSPYHGAYRDATKVYVSPNERYVTDNGGTIYTTADLLFAGSVGGPFDDLTFTSAGQSVVLRGGMLFLYDLAFNETGRVSSGIDAARAFVQGQNVLIFGYPPSGGAIVKTTVPLAQITAQPVGPALDPNTVAFTPDTTFIDRDGVVFLYSKLNQQLFRWSTATRQYLPSLPLQGWPDFVTYSATNHRVYLGYPDARIRQIKLDAGSTTEEAFANAPQQVMNLATAGEYVFLVDPTGAWCSYLLFAPDGTLKAQREWSYYGAEYVWNPVLRRMYQFRDDTSPNDLLYTEITTAGTFGTQMDSPYHGGISTTYPIRISPDGGSILLGSGKFFDANTMAVNNSLANPIKDAVWVKGKLITARTTATGIELQRWGANNYGLDVSQTLTGRLIRIFPVGLAQLVAVTVRNTVPYYTIFDENLNVLSTDAGVPPPRLGNLATRGFAGTGDQTLIPSFVVRGAKAKKVLIRAAGPALIPYDVVTALVDPILKVMTDKGVVIATNDDWGSASNLAEMSAAAVKVGAFPFASGSKDSSILMTLNPGTYSAMVSGANNTTGVALVEVYDVDDVVGSSRVINMSARALVGSGESVLIPSVVIQGNLPKTLLIRAVGPGLVPYGVSGTVKDPVLRIYQGSQVVYQNDNWEQQSSSVTAAQIVAAGKATGAFELQPGSSDSALLVTLDPGAYTAQVSSADGTTGVALVEIYELPN